MVTRADAAGGMRFMGNQQAVGLLQRGNHRIDIERYCAAQVDNFSRDAVFLLQGFGRL